MFEYFPYKDWRIFSDFFLSISRDLSNVSFIVLLFYILSDILIYDIVSFFLSWFYLKKTHKEQAFVFLTWFIKTQKNWEQRVVEVDWCLSAEKKWKQNLDIDDRLVVIKSIVTVKQKILLQKMLIWK